MLKNFWNDENGFVISAELVLVLTIAVIGIIVGLSHVAMAVNSELSDIAQAIGSLDQSFGVSGYSCCTVNSIPTAFSASSNFDDAPDHCDCATSCDLVVTPGTSGKTEG